MVGEIAGLMSALKSAKDVAQTMIGLRDAAAMQAKTVEFQSKIFDAMERAIAAQEERATLLQKIDDLERQMARLETWEADKQCYEMKDAGNGALAYALKEEHVGKPEPAHWICPQCYQHAKKSVLQPEIRDHGLVSCLACNECGSDFITRGERNEEARSRRRR